MWVKRHHAAQAHIYCPLNPSCYARTQDGMKIFALVTAILLLGAHNLGADEPVRIGGTGTGIILMQKLAEAYLQQQPGANIRPLLPPLGSGGSLHALRDGVIEIAVTGRVPRDGEGRFQTLDYAQSPLVIASHGRRPMQNFTTRDLVGVYAGRQAAWPDGEPIRLVLRLPFESDNIVLRQLSPDMGSAIEATVARKAGPVAEDDLDAADLLESLPGSLGSTTLGLLRTRGRPLTVHMLDGSPPTLDHLASGRYPLAKPLFVITRASPDGATADFVRFLQSPAVRDLLLRLHFLPGFR
jgi:phosphate transport system substrate-binding protein